MILIFQTLNGRQLLNMFSWLRAISAASPTKGGLSPNTAEFLKCAVAPGVWCGFPARTVAGLMAANPYAPAGATDPHAIVARWQTASSRGMEEKALISHCARDLARALSTPLKVIRVAMGTPVAFGGLGFLATPYNGHRGCRVVYADRVSRLKKGEVVRRVTTFE